MTINVHGNHVIQMCLDFLCDDERKKPIYNTVIENCGLISTDKHGCCVIQKMLSTTDLSIKVKVKWLKLLELADCAELGSFGRTY